LRRGSDVEEGLAMVTSSRLKLRNLDIDARHDLLAEATGLDRSVLNASGPKRA
jgi:hypothetical protein